MIIYHKLGAKTLSWTVLYYSDYCPISMDHTNGKRNPQRVDTWRAEVTMRHSSLTSPPWDTVSHWTWSSKTCLDWLSSNPRTSSYCSLAEGLQAHVWFSTECWGPELSPASTSVRKPSPQSLAKHILPKYFHIKLPRKPGEGIAVTASQDCPTPGTWMLLHTGFPQIQIAFQIK